MLLWVGISRDAEREKDDVLLLLTNSVPVVVDDCDLESELLWLCVSDGVTESTLLKENVVDTTLVKLTVTLSRLLVSLMDIEALAVVVMEIDSDVF